MHREFRLAWRRLWTSPAFTVVAVTSLALAIALSTTMYGIIDAYFRPVVPFHKPDRLLVLTPSRVRNAAQSDVNRIGALQRGIPSFVGVAAFGSGGAVVVLSSRGNVTAEATKVTGSFFSVLGEQPAYGRLFTGTREDVSQRAAVITDRLWAQLSGLAHAFTPFPVRLNGEPFTVVGVLPPNGEFPVGTDVFVLTDDAQVTGRYLARLRPKATLSEVRAELRVIGARLAIAKHEIAEGQRTRFTLEPAVAVPSRLDRMHLILLLAAAIVLVLACGNVANLQLGRGLARSEDLAIRSALGASRRSLILHLLTESLIISAVGGLIGILMSFWGISLLRAVVPSSVGWLGLVEPRLSWRVVACGVSLSGFTAILIGLVPALRLSSMDAGVLLRTGVATSQGARARRYHGLLVVMEVAGALVLVSVSSLLIETAHRLDNIDVGYDTANLISALVRLRTVSDTVDATAALSRATTILNRLSEMPDVGGAARAFRLVAQGGVVTVDEPSLRQREVLAPYAQLRLVTPNYLKTLRLPIVRGRDFTTEDASGSPVAIIDETAAAHFWPGLDPVGRMIKLGNEHSDRRWARVIGVARHPIFLAGAGCLTADCYQTTIFLVDHNIASYGNAPLMAEFAIRVPASLKEFALKWIRVALGDDPGLLFFVQPWEHTIGLDKRRQSHHFMAALFTAFAIFGLMLAMIGIYGVVAQAVTQRTREFGIRIALGAHTRQILRLVLWEGNMLVLAGLVLGLLLAIWSAGLIEFFISEVGVDSIAPAFLALASVATYGTAIGASLIPALRATQVCPIDALRME